ncbi:MAG: hypothetical protein OXF88_09980 [Rhodobacteraceae bacterium]|nr:hypothetical protein [Paracoccaceae bacterium]MCY4140357.1 hypothetical protein [Paracoccaceae bacterium]
MEKNRSIGWLGQENELVAYWEKMKPETRCERNYSNLAHGCKPLCVDGWKRTQELFNDGRTVIWKELLDRTTAYWLPSGLQLSCRTKATVRVSSRRRSCTEDQPVAMQYLPVIAKAPHRQQQVWIA